MTSTLPPEDIRREIEEAARLRREIAQATDQLDRCKALIREHAESLLLAAGRFRAQGGSVELPSGEGVCTVVFVKDRLQVTRPATAESLRSVLSDKLWSALFEFKPVLRDDAAALFATLSAEDQRRLSGLVEIREQEARVGLPK